MKFSVLHRHSRTRRARRVLPELAQVECLENRELPAVLTFPVEQYPSFEGSRSMDGRWNRVSWVPSSSFHYFTVSQYGMDWPNTPETGNDIWFASRLNGTFTIEPQAGEEIGDQVKVTVAASFTASSSPNVSDAQVSFIASLQNTVFLTKSLSGDFPQETVSGNTSAIMRIGDTFQAAYLMEGSAHAPDVVSFFHLGPDGALSYSLRVEPYVEADITVNELTWNDATGGVDAEYSFANAPGASESSSLELYWARGNKIADIIGGPLDTLSVGPKPKTASTWYVTPEKIGVPPALATHLIVVADKNHTLEEVNETDNVFAWKHNLAGQSLMRSSLDELYPGSKDLNKLSPSFGVKVQNFIGALQAAGIQPEIKATYRPPERAYLMHWAWRIVKQDLDASQIPAYPGVDINWNYGSAALSKQAAQEMLTFLDIGANLKTAPALESRHTEGLAIDMQISWSGKKVITNASGKNVKIKNAFGSAVLNKKLIKLAATYGVMHFVPAASDTTHWSSDGN